MPIFEYRCSNCNEIFEQLVLGRRDNHVECPACGRSEVKQLLSTFSARVASGASDCPARSAGACQASGGGAG